MGGTGKSALLGALSAEQAYSVGSAIGSLLKDGMPIERARSSTQAVDRILDEEAVRFRLTPKCN
jgi:hypothetical protein